MYFLSGVMRGFSQHSPGPCPLHLQLGCSVGCSSPSQTLQENRQGERGAGVWVLSWCKGTDVTAPIPTLHTHHVPCAQVIISTFLISSFPSLLLLALAGQRHIQEQPCGLQPHPSRLLPSGKQCGNCSYSCPELGLHFPASHTQTHEIPCPVCSHWETYAERVIASFQTFRN